jgi:hypothetical protein
MKVGDLVRNTRCDRGLGLFLRWRTFDEKSNPYTCPEILWIDGDKITVATIQASLLEVISESR